MACTTGGARLPVAVEGTGSSVGPGGPAGVGSPVITGTWRRTLVVTTPTDVVTSETTWLFASGGSCQRTVVSNSVLQGVPLTQHAACTYLVASGRVTVHFDGTSGTVSFAVQVSGNRLFLDDVEFVRIG